jgi:hypothetical protein
VNEVEQLVNRSRSAVIAAAAGRIGTKDASSFWTVCGAEPFDKRKAWCGIFALWCLREAGLADFQWEFGKGFLYRLQRTATPKPGDIGYIDAPFQHHLIFERIDEDGVHSIDGNTPRVARKVRPLGKVTAFYSIEPLILAAHAKVAYPDPPEAA